MKGYHASIRALRSEIEALDVGYHEIIAALGALDFRPFDEQIAERPALVAQLKQITVETECHQHAIRVLTNLSTPLPAAAYDARPRASRSEQPAAQGL